MGVSEFSIAVGSLLTVLRVHHYYPVLSVGLPLTLCLAWPLSIGLAVPLFFLRETATYDAERGMHPDRV